MTVIGVHPQRLDLYVHPGDPIDFGVPVLDGDGEAVSLSGGAATITAPDGTLLHDFSPSIVDGQVRVVAGSDVTATWSWSVYAGRLAVKATPSGGDPAPILSGWVRLYR